MPALRSILARFTRSFAFVGLTAYIVGSAVSLYVADADSFHRFGALGVAASFLFFSDRLTKIELGRQRSVERLLHEYGVELAVLRSGKAATEIPLDGFAVDYLTEERNFDTLRHKADTFNIFNVLLITVATLQWGFGDKIIVWLSERFPDCAGSAC